MATHEYTRTSNGITVGAGTDYTFTVSEFSVPAGQKFTRYKVIKAINVSNMDLRAISGQTSKPVWDEWNTNKALIGWTDGSTSKVNVHNSNSSGKSFRVSVVFETEDLPYTAVTKGNKIMATDRSQTGQTTTVGAVIQDSHFSSGVSAEASTFNKRVLGM